MMGSLDRDSSSYTQEYLRAKLREFEGLLATLCRTLHPGEQTDPEIGLSSAAAITKPGLPATNGSMSATEGQLGKTTSMNQSRPQRAAAGDQDPQTEYSGIHSIRDSTGGWRWIVAAADVQGKAKSFPVDADEAAAKEADKVALLKCPQKNVLPHLNFPMSEYGASKDKSMAHIVRKVVEHFQPLCKALPHSVQKQLAEADMALAANVGLTKPAKRSRKADEQWPSGAQQKHSTPAKPSVKRPLPTVQSAAEPDVDTSSDGSDLPEGVVQNTEPVRPLKRLKRLREMEYSGSQPVGEACRPKASAFSQKLKEPEQPNVKVHAPQGTEEAPLNASAHAAIDMHELGSPRDREAQQASELSEGSKGQPWAQNRQPPAAACMQASGEEASAAQRKAAVQRREDQPACADGAAHNGNQVKQSSKGAAATACIPKKSRVQEQRAEAMESGKRRKLEPFRPPGAPASPARGRPTMQSLLFASQPVRPSSAQAASGPGAANKQECPACSPPTVAATSAGQPDTSCVLPQQATDIKMKGSADPPNAAPKPSKGSTPAQLVKIAPPATNFKQNNSAQGGAVADVISMKLGNLHRPAQPHGSAPSSREYIFTGRGSQPFAGTMTAGGFQNAAGSAASAVKANAGEDTDWSTDDRQSADQADARADIQLRSSRHGTDAAASGQPLSHSSKDRRGQLSWLQKAGDTDGSERGGAEGQPATPGEHEPAEAVFRSPPPPVRTLEDDLAEQMEPGRSAATTAQHVKAEASAAAPQQGMPEHSLQHEQPEVKAEQSGQQAQAPSGGETGPSEAGGALPEGLRAAGTVADPVVISDSDSSDDELEEPSGVKQTYASATMPGIPGQRVHQGKRGNINDPRQRPGSLRSPVGIGPVPNQAAAGRRLFSARRNASTGPPGPQPAGASSGAPAQQAPAQPVRQQADHVRGQQNAASGAAFQPQGAWPQSASAQSPQHVAQLAAAAAAYREALCGQPAGTQRRSRVTARTAAWKARPPQPRPNAPPQAQTQPTAFVDLGSSSDASSSSVHGTAAPASTSMQDTEQARQDPQPRARQAEEGVTSPLSGRSLGAHRRPTAATGSMFRPVPPVPRYVRRASAAQPAPSSQAATEGAPAGTATAAMVPEADQSAAAPSQAPAYTSEDSPSKLILERDRAALAEADAAEWQARRAVVEKQAEEARREKQRRRAQAERDGERARRSQARLEDHRRQKAEQEAEQGEREVLRQRVRAELEARVKWLRGPDAILRALNVPLEMEPGNPFRADLTKTVRKARLTYHPDRHQGRSLQAQVEAEEIFKMLALVKT